jgi:hypothetical protein
MGPGHCRQRCARRQQLLLVLADVGAEPTGARGCCACACAAVGVQAAVGLEHHEAALVVETKVGAQEAGAAQGGLDHRVGDLGGRDGPHAGGLVAHGEEGWGAEARSARREHW